jgi:hypothetical protein
LTFQGIRLPMQPLRSWLHLLSRAGMLGTRPPEPAISVLRRPDEDEEDTPTRIEELGFELSTEMILDFAQFARHSRPHDATEQALAEAEAEAQTTDVAESSPSLSSAGLEELRALEMAASVPPESVDQDFLDRETPALVVPSEVASAPQEPDGELSPTLESPVPVDEPRVETTEHTPDLPVVPEQPELMAEAAASELVGQVESGEVPAPAADAPEMLSLPEANEVTLPSSCTAMDMADPQEHSAESFVEPSQPDIARNGIPERDVPVATGESEPGLESGAEALAGTEAPAVDLLQSVVQAPLNEETTEALPLEMADVAQELEEQLRETVVASDGHDEQVLAPEQSEVAEAPKAAGPVIVVSGVRIVRKPVVRPRPAIEPARANLTADTVKESEPEIVAALEAPDAHVDEAIASSAAPDIEHVVEQPIVAIGEVAVQPDAESLAAVMHWEPVEPDQYADLALAAVPQGASPQEGTGFDEFGFEPMIASLEDALATLAAAHADPTAPVGPHIPKRAAKTASTSVAAQERQVDDSIPEAPALRGIFIQKETEMTEMHDESIEADAQATAPITSVELQEVAATLSVPQLEADPDDVLSDVQSTLNSLAGMAQGLTQQKQAAGRLQEELEEWNNQLQERERLAGDKEERLRQLENHLKEAKTNLDRMAAENNRLLAERSEALKELAQTVDLRDKTTLKRAESLQLEQQRIDEQAANLRNRSGELDERESTLKRKGEELGVRLKQLQSAKDKFSTIVKSFNETVQFNSTLSAISKTVNE